MSNARRCSVAALILTLLLVRCDNGTGPEEVADFDSLWPNQDGNSWTFHHVEYAIPDSSAAALANIDPEKIDELDWRDIEKRLSLDPPEEALATWYFEEGTMTLSLDGTVDTPFGAKQNLRSRYESIESRSDTLEVTLYATKRPPAATKNLLSGPLLGRSTGRSYAFERQDDWIGYFHKYRDYGNDSLFTFVRGPLTVGSRFEQQLTHASSDDIWVRGWIAGNRWIETEAGTFWTVVVVYLIDVREVDVTNETGETLGTYQTFSIFLLAYSPFIGPVYQVGYHQGIPAHPELGPEDGSSAFYESSLTGYRVGGYWVSAR